jgi:pimeloyl-ACP methyl ester carboxylesterase
MDRYQHAGLTFEVTDRGAGEPVVLLHGFPSDRHAWDGLADRLVASSRRVLAPDQRGYSPSARPRARAEYRVDRLVADVMVLVRTAGLDRFHVVGHDWGAAVAWYLAGARPDRVASLTALSVPHPAAMGAAVRRGRQALRSWYMLAFQVPFLPELALGSAGGRGLAWALRRGGLDAATASRYAARARQPEGWHGPLGWYRALPLELRAPARPVTVPTLMIWGPDDAFITRAAAEGAARWVEADYRFVEVPGGDHWLPERFPDAVAAAVLPWLAAHPV